VRILYKFYIEIGWFQEARFRQKLCFSGIIGAAAEIYGDAVHKGVQF
jgi:hypothetical protein